MSESSVTLAEKRLALAMQRARTRPRFMARVLELYRQQEGWNQAEIMEFVECRGGDFSRLALCQAPDALAADFRLRVTRIADSVGANALALAQILRQVAHLERSANLVPNAQIEPLALAARERAASDETDLEETPDV